MKNVLKEIYVSMLLITSGICAVEYNDKNDIVQAFMKAYSASFGNGANVFDKKLKEPQIMARWQSLNYNGEYKSSRWYGPLMAFMFEDLKSYIERKSTLKIIGTDKNIMASYNTIINATKDMISIIHDANTSLFARASSDQARAQEASFIICQLTKDIKTMQAEQKNPVLIKLAKEFTTASSKKDAIFVLQKVAMIMEDTATKMIKDIAYKTQKFNADLPSCCAKSPAGSKVCPSLVLPQNKNVTQKTMSKGYNEGMSGPNYSFD